MAIDYFSRWVVGWIKWKYNQLSPQLGLVGTGDELGKTHTNSYLPLTIWEMDGKSKTGLTAWASLISSLTGKENKAGENLTSLHFPWNEHHNLKSQK